MAEPIPFLDVGAGYRELEPELTAAYHRVMDGGCYVLGPELEAFEAEFAAYVGTRGCVGVGSGLDALRLILWGYDIGPGDEVIVPAHTFIATWFAVSLMGARPIPVDVDAATGNLDAAALTAVVTPRTRAVIAVHLYGQPADMDAVRAAVAGRDIRVIEDAAQAHGADYRGRRAGSLGDAAAFSFYPAKNLGAHGDGGAVLSDDEALLERVRALRNYGSPHKYHHDRVAVNSRLDELQAALLRVKLRHLDGWNARRAAVAQRYAMAFEGSEVVRALHQLPGTQSAWHLFVVCSEDRAKLGNQLKECGIQTQIHYPVPPHRSDAYRSEYAHLRFEGAERMSREVLSLPIGPHLRNVDVEAVIDAVGRAV